VATGSSGSLPAAVTNQPQVPIEVRTLTRQTEERGEKGLLLQGIELQQEEKGKKERRHQTHTSSFNKVGDSSINRSRKSNIQNQKQTEN
jgi:hypothetical protein